MRYIDTHCHLYLDQFSLDREEVVARAAAAGVAKILLPAIDSTTHEAMLATEEQFPACQAMMGLHPCSVKDDYRKELDVAAGYFARRKFIAVGEIGLDFYWDKTFTKEQYAAFETQIGWALEYKVPIVVHSRESTRECIEVVQRYAEKGLTGVFHCFSGTIEEARSLTDIGFYLGIGGVVTFKKSGLDRIVEEMGLEFLLLETDAPYLAPVPYRGKRNESSYLPYVISKIAGILSVPEEEVASVTTRNAEKLFGLQGG